MRYNVWAPDICRPAPRQLVERIAKTVDVVRLSVPIGDGDFDYINVGDPDTVEDVSFAAVGGVRAVLQALPSCTYLHSEGVPTLSVWEAIESAADLGLLISLTLECAGTGTDGRPINADAESRRYAYRHFDKGAGYNARADLGKLARLIWEALSPKGKWAIRAFHVFREWWAPGGHQMGPVWAGDCARFVHDRLRGTGVATQFEVWSPNSGTYKQAVPGAPFNEGVIALPPDVEVEAHPFSHPERSVAEEAEFVRRVCREVRAEWPNRRLVLGEQALFRGGGRVDNSRTAVGSDKLIVAWEAGEDEADDISAFIYDSGEWGELFVRPPKLETWLVRGNGDPAKGETTAAWHWWSDEVAGEIDVPDDEPEPPPAPDRPGPWALVVDPVNAFKFVRHAMRLVGDGIKAKDVVDNAPYMKSLGNAFKLERQSSESPPPPPDPDEGEEPPPSGGRLSAVDYAWAANVMASPGTQVATGQAFSKKWAVETGIFRGEGDTIEDAAHDFMGNGGSLAPSVELTAADRAAFDYLDTLPRRGVNAAIRFSNERRYHGDCWTERWGANHPPPTTPHQSPAGAGEDIRDWVESE